jgi:hypothetical protein
VLLVLQRQQLVIQTQQQQQQQQQQQGQWMQWLVGYLLQLLLVKQQLWLSSRLLMTLCRKHQSRRQQH